MILLPQNPPARRTARPSLSNVAKLGVLILREQGLNAEFNPADNDLQAVRVGMDALAGRPATTSASFEEQNMARAATRLSEQISESTDLPVAWMSSLGLPGLVTLVECVELARKLGVNFALWSQTMTANEVVTVTVYELRDELNLRQADAKVLVDEAVQAAAIMQITGTPPANLMAEISETAPRNLEIGRATKPEVVEIVDIVAETTTPARRPLTKKECRAEGAVQRKLAAEAPAPIPACDLLPLPTPLAPSPPAKILAKPIDLAKVIGTVGKPGDRIIGEEGEVHYLCIGFNGKHCLVRVDQNRARISSDPKVARLAYFVPAGRLIVAQDLNRDDRHPVYCEACAKRYFKNEGDDALFSDLLEVANGRTEEVLFQRGCQLVVNLLGQDTADGYPRETLVALALWEPTVREIFRKYAVDTLSERQARAEAQAEAETRIAAENLERQRKRATKGDRNVNNGLSKFSKPKTSPVEIKVLPARLAPQLAVAWATKGVQMNPNPFAQKKVASPVAKPIVAASVTVDFDEAETIEMDVPENDITTNF